MFNYRIYFVIIIVIFFGCTEEPGSIENQFDVSEDAEGNLLILNRLNAPILLYTSEEDVPVKEIGAKEDFLVNIPSDGSLPTLLRVWKKSQVLDASEPDINNIYREWSIILSNTQIESEQVIWVIKSASASPCLYPSFHSPSYTSPSS